MFKIEDSKEEIKPIEGKDSAQTTKAIPP